MKRLIVLIIISVLFIGNIYAQDREVFRQRLNNPVTVEGTFKLEGRFAAVQNGDNVFFVPLLGRYVNFIDELVDGVIVSIEGYEFRNMIHPVKLTIGDKSYDFASRFRSDPELMERLRLRFEEGSFFSRRNENRTERPDRLERTERPQRPEGFKKQGRFERPEHSERPYPNQSRRSPFGR